jgi:hypothetical protein
LLKYYRKFDILSVYATIVVLYFFFKLRHFEISQIITTGFRNRFLLRRRMYKNYRIHIIKISSANIKKIYRRP